MHVFPSVSPQFPSTIMLTVILQSILFICYEKLNESVNKQANKKNLAISKILPDLTFGLQFCGSCL